MASGRQIAANQANARKSTGPRTKRGKNVMRFNALQHGMRAGEILIPGEDGREFEALKHAVHKELSPVGELEKALVERIVTMLWRLQRAPRMEAALFEMYRAQFEVSRAERLREKGRDIFKEIDWRKDVDVEQIIAHVDQALDGLDEDGPMLGRAIARALSGGELLTKLYRYEHSIEASLDRALDRLRQHQKERGTLTISVDVEHDPTDGLGEMPSS